MTRNSDCYGYLSHSALFDSLFDDVGYLNDLYVKPQKSFGEEHKAYTRPQKPHPPPTWEPKSHMEILRISELRKHHHMSCRCRLCNKPHYKVRPKE